jgi:spore germination protein GerM
MLSLFAPVFRRTALPVLSIVLLSSSLSGCNWWGQPPQQQPVKPGIESEATTSPRDIVTIFFSRAQGNQVQLADVARPIPDEVRREPLRFAVTELLKGPRPNEKKQGFYSEIPKGTRLIDINRKKDVVVVNLTKQFATGGGSTSMTQRIEELKRTVYSIDSQHQLSLTVEGKPLELLGGEGLEVPDVLKRTTQ